MVVKPRVCVVTAGHLSTCPRMLKAADALHGAGYSVRVISARFMPWAVHADRDVRTTREWPWTVIDYSKATGSAARRWTGARYRAARALAAAVGPAHLPGALASRAHSRVHDELAAAIAAEPVDLVYGGTSGALAPVAAAAHRLNVPYALDLEDLHTGDQAGPDSELTHATAERVERAVLPGAAFLTASSPMIADAYRDRYGVASTPIHNTFSIDFGPLSVGDESRPLRLYWFSQTLGPGRGLEDVVAAVGLLGISVDLELRAYAPAGEFDRLMALQRQMAPTLRITLRSPAPPDAMVSLAQAYDLGLACEQPDTPNRRYCLSNKAFTYLAAGVPVALTATPAQRALAADLGDAALLFEAHQPEALAERLREWVADRARRTAARRAARAAAERRWHWEHEADRGALLAAVAAVLPLSASAKRCAS